MRERTRGRERERERERKKRDTGIPASSRSQKAANTYLDVLKGSEPSHSQPSSRRDQDPDLHMLRNPSPRRPPQAPPQK